MIQRFSFLSGGLLVTLLCSFGCGEDMVGAPCKPETDDGKYNADAKTTYAIETRSVQCETTMCVTKTETNPNAAGGQQKYSFCSCRCKDKDNHGLDKNNDKYDDLCECPPGSVCSPKVVSNNIEDIPDKLKGSYCIPSCIEKSCPGNEVCTPSSDSDEPWKWKCKLPK